MADGIPRRIRMDLWTAAERAIHLAMKAVEEAGADVRLTDATVLLQQAADRVADFVDGVDEDERPPEHRIGESFAVPGSNGHVRAVAHEDGLHIDGGALYGMVLPWGPLFRIFDHAPVSAPIATDDDERPVMRERLRNAQETLDALCSGKMRWTMSVPARPESDPALVIGRSLNDLGKLLAAPQRAEGRRHG